MYVSAIHKMKKAEIEAELSSVTYSEAITWYYNLSKSFLSQLSQAGKEIGEDNLRKELIEAVKEINQNPVEDQQNLMQEMFAEFRNFLTDRLSGKNNELRQRADKLYNEERKSKEKMKQETQKLSEEIVSDDVLDEWIRTFLSEKYSVYSKGFVSEDFFNSFRAYARRYLSRSPSYRKKTSYRYYVNAAKGYAREALIYSAFQKAFKEYSERSGKDVVRMVGSEKINNADTVYDILISFLAELDLNTLVNAEEEFPMEDALFGIQAKSFKLNIGDFDKSIGSRSELLKLANSLSHSDFWSWIDGVKFLERYAADALGRYNVGYVTGDSFLFTYSFIKRMVDMKYYIAFVFNKEHMATSKVTWQQIQSDENSE